MTKLNVLIYIVVPVIASIIFISFIYLSFSQKPVEKSLPSINPSEAPTSSPFVFPPGQIDTENLNRHPTTRTPAQIITKEGQEVLDNDFKIGQLTKKLPYTGEKFTLSYDFDKNSFTVLIDQSEKEEGLKELDDFLNQNGIKDRNLLYNLSIQNE